MMVQRDGESDAAYQARCAKTTLVQRLGEALREAKTIYIDDCFGREDDAFKARIDSLLREAGIES